MVAIRCWLLAVGGVVLALAAPAAGADGPKPAPGAVEVRLADGTTQKVTLLDQKIDFTTPYGKVSVPAADVQSLDLAMRIPEEVAKEAEKAIADLGSNDFQTREAASATLVRLGARAYPMVLEASRSGDAEVKRRAEAVLEKIRKGLPADALKPRKNDALTAGGCTFNGRVESAALRVRTSDGKEKELALADVRRVLSAAAKAAAAASRPDARPDPGTLASVGGAVGTVYYFNVTGANAGSLWGSGVYTSDSSIAKAAVHAGVLKVGETAVVKVTVVAPPPSYVGETRNGVTSSSYGAWPAAYTVEKADTDE